MLFRPQHPVCSQSDIVCRRLLVPDGGNEFVIELDVRENTLFGRNVLPV